jgi:hypothetical protein
MVGYIGFVKLNITKLKEIFLFSQVVVREVSFWVATEPAHLVTNISIFYGSANYPKLSQRQIVQWIANDVLSGSIGFG